MPLGIGREARQVDDGELRHEAGKLAGRRPAQQVADEQRVPGILDEDARIQPVRGVGAGEQVLHVTARATWHARGNPAHSRSNCSGVIGLLLSHHTALSVVASRTGVLVLRPSGRCGRRSPRHKRARRRELRLASADGSSISSASARVVIALVAEEFSGNSSIVICQPPLSKHGRSADRQRCSREVPSAAEEWSGRCDLTHLRIVTAHHGLSIARATYARQGLCERGPTWQSAASPHRSRSCR